MARKSPTASGVADTTPAAPMPPASTEASTTKKTATNPQARITKLFATLRELISSAPEADRATALAEKLFRGNPNPGAKPVTLSSDGCLSCKGDPTSLKGRDCRSGSFQNVGETERKLAWIQTRYEGKTGYIH
jgi:hypothetical protein